ncbi:dehydrogenase/reductase SDR family member 1-like isoform X2 [Ostrea edulis]|nr:dehydrogenase/reductase SDR family member 1-like isoform X2 [Ostrea edulis]XP_048766051.2 dehydrogenase/reductase SDR family member 1-like isoform X2 [Ostrea edulis]
MSLRGKVCLVTGATRGIGHGIALQLGEAGATVYITGRTLTQPPGEETVGSCLTDTAKEVEARGGKCIPVQCDHSKDEDVEELFQRVKTEQNGQLDILVNNAYSAVTAIMKNMGVPYWEQPMNMWDTVNNVGLRNHYLCAVHAARLMVPRKQGLIVNISSVGGLRYLFNVPYGIGKEACDRMATDCAMELKKHCVAFVSLWPGIVKTEHMLNFSDNIEENHMEKLAGPNAPVKVDAKIMKNSIARGETPEFSGKCIVHLAQDPNIMKKSGYVLMTAELGEEYGIKDIDGRTIPSFRQLNQFPGVPGIRWLPNWVRLPMWVMAMGGRKF